MRERREHHAGDIRMSRLDLTGHRKGIIVGITRHTDHQIDIRRVQHLIGLLSSRHLGEGRWIAHTQFHILVEDLLVDTTIILQHEGIIGIGHNEHVEDTSRHQVDKRHILQIKFVPLLWNLYLFHDTVLSFRLQKYEKSPILRLSFGDFFIYPQWKYFVTNFSISSG